MNNIICLLLCAILYLFLATVIITCGVFIYKSLVELNKKEINYAFIYGFISLFISIALFGCITYKLNTKSQLEEYKQYKNKINEAQREMEIWLEKHPEFNISEID